MSEIRIEWDPRKDTENRRKHGVSFQEAEASARLRVLVVVHAFKETTAIIRIISARKANRRERAVYDQRWQR